MPSNKGSFFDLVAHKAVFDMILAHPVLLPRFRAYLDTTYQSNNLLFFEAVYSAQ